MGGEDSSKNRLKIRLRREKKVCDRMRISFYLENGEIGDGKQAGFGGEKTPLRKLQKPKRGGTSSVVQLALQERTKLKEVVRTQKDASALTPKHNNQANQSA